MAKIILCQTDNFPCPEHAQQLITEPSLDDLAAFGITPASIAAGISFGFSAVLVFFVLGYCAHIVIRLIRGI